VAIIFDWDGTLSNSMPAVLKLYSGLARKYFGVDEGTAKSNFLSNQGAGLRSHLIRLLASTNREISEEELSNLTQTFAKLFHEKIMAAPLFNEVPQVLHELKQNGYNLCVSSGMLEEQLIQVVTSKGVERYFTFILGTRNSFHKGFPHFDFISRKLSIEPNQMVFVGDGDYDMSVGREYGCFTVGRIDQIDAETLLSAGADTVISNLKSLPQIIRDSLNPNRQ